MAAKCSVPRTVIRFSRISGLALLLVLAALPTVAQIHGIPPSVTSIPLHSPPYGVPNIPASVTSLGPYGYCCQPPSNRPYYNQAYPNYYNRRGYNGRGYGYGYGYSYAVPYYVYPTDDTGYAAGGGPYLYSGPPQGQTPPPEQTLHIIVESAPRNPVPEDQVADAHPDRTAAQASLPDAKPGEPTILVFRDGHKQEVTNYAIMGSTVYVFDNRTKKIALADLDVPATIKANDDQGVEFQVPKAKQPSKPTKSSGVPLQSAPDEVPRTSTNSSTATP